MTAASIATDVLVLLKRGRVAPALLQLERLPRLIAAELADRVGAAYREGYLEGQQTLAREIAGTGKPKRTPGLKPHEWLAARIADPELRERAKQVLRLDDALLDAIAEGGVGLGSSSWRKLREALDR